MSNTSWAKTNIIIIVVFCFSELEFLCFSEISFRLSHKLFHLGIFNLIIFLPFTY